MEDDGISPAVGLIGALVLSYITATPGPLQATWDIYVVAPFRNLTQPTLSKKDVIVGRKLAQGGFGTVFLGTAGATIPGKIRKGQVGYRKHGMYIWDTLQLPVQFAAWLFACVQKIIIKKATEFGEAEVWMNERLNRAAPDSCATFLTAFPDGPPRVGTPLALVFKFEGSGNLFDALQARNFPQNVEQSLLGRELRIDDPTTRNLATVKVCQM
jgi:hypothetical protein